jgi:hypothetical protein
VGNRLDESTSVTAAMTCSIRAASFYEKDPCLKSDDFIAPLLLPRVMQPAVKSGLIRRLFMRFMAPKGIYEYVIARTKYVDEALGAALADGIRQIVLPGAYFIFATALVLRIKKRDPELYKERTAGQKEGKRWDKILLLIYSVLLLLMLATAGLDAVRFQLSRVPLGVKIGAFTAFVPIGALFF